ncbi:MAG: beta-ketoacyl-ACP synthase II, partial [Lentisphaerae bacterium]|nr:beta-ketoacyl-ACP synthase II [Lentisphaerota bacterium]
MSSVRRVVVCGAGVVSPIGNSLAQAWENLLSGRSGIVPLSKFPCDEYRCRIAGEVKDFDITRYLDSKTANRLDPYCHYALAAADEALSQAGLLAEPITDLSRCGMLVASGIGGISTICQQQDILRVRGAGRVSPLTIPMLIADMASGYLAIKYGWTGPNFGLVSACASGLHAIGEAYWVIKRGDAEVMLAGGSEAALVPLGIAGFASMRALSTRNDDPEHASRPFDANRDGFVPAEGAGVLVLEELSHALARGAKPLAEIRGYGATCDAYHITAPCDDGAGAAAAMTAALRQAGLAASDIDYINAHGTSTPLNDLVETKAIKLAFAASARRVAISSTKAQTGHMLGAAGGFESAVCVRALQEGIIPGTMNYETPDP